jgi:protein-disulfide isomerase
MASREEEKKRRREEREAREADAAAKDRRTRRLRMLGLALAAAVVVVVVAIVISTSGGSDKGGKQTGQADGIAEMQKLLNGIPQNGFTLGNPNAKVTLVEFADLRCPFCKEYTDGAFPTLVNDYVRSGKVKIEFRNFAILGPESEKAANAAAAAAKSNKAWNFIDLFYRNQGDEQTPYVTDAFIERIATGAGLSPTPIVTASNADNPDPSLAAANTEAQKYGFDSTPSFLLGQTGKPLTKLDLSDPSDPNQFKQAIEPLLAE